MKRYNIEALYQALEEVGIETGDTLFVHSSLLALGMIRLHAPHDFPAAHHRALVDAVGPSGTLIVPTFTFAFCRGEGFHRQQTPSEEMGTYAEYVRTLPGSLRSPHPIHSVAALGPSAEIICTPDPLSGFGRDGSYGAMWDLDAKIVLLGAPMNTATPVHFAEELVTIPYRYWKDFTGPYQDGDTRTTRTYQKYVRDLYLDPEVDQGLMEEPLRKGGYMREAILGGGYVRVFSFRDFVQLAISMLQEDPFSLVLNRKEVLTRYYNRPAD